MPNVFPPTTAKTATVPITVTPAGLACTVEVFLGPNQATKSSTSGKIAFTSTGVAQNVNVSVPMPSGGGTFHVFIDVMYQTSMLASFQATEDVTIATAVVGPPIWS